MDSLFYVLGLVICGCGLLQMVLWTSATVANHRYNRHHLQASRRLMSEQIATAQQSQNAKNAEGGWQGYREFYVAKLEPEAVGITSVYLKPVDAKPIASFNSGQHLSLRFHVPGESRPIVRCYSLSTGPRDDCDYYRISVKEVAPPLDRSDLPAGRVSSYVNAAMMAGDTIEAKSPSGSFVLSHISKAPVVLMAGGIGITPILSMLEELVGNGSQQTIVLLYGVKCGRVHAFKDHITRIAQQHRNVYVVNCYSDPESGDRYGIDYQCQGRVSIDLVKQLMPNNKCNFYMCGPPEFMQSLQNGLAKWGVPDNRIRYEVFGPATIRKTSQPKADSKNAEANIEFVQTGKRVAWNCKYESILDAAESQEIIVESGCRAGSCKTCSIPLIDGTVRYPEGIEAQCESGECLPCIAIPDGDVKIDA